MRELAAVLWGLACATAVWWSAGHAVPAALAAFRPPAGIETALLAHWVRWTPAVLVAGLFGVAFLGAGTRALGWLGLFRRPGIPGRLSFRFAAGAAFYAIIAAGLGLCGLLFTPVALAALAFLTAAGAGCIREIRGAVIGVISGEGRTFKWYAGLLALLLGAFAMAPETWTDALAYHLAAPADMARLHKIFDTVQVTYRYPLLMEELLAQGFLIAGEPAAKLLNLAGLAATCALLFSWASSLAGSLAGFLALAALLSSNLVGFHIGHLNEGFYSMAFGLAAVWAWSRRVSSGGSAAWALFAGALMGWATCAKYTTAVPLLGMAAWHLMRMGRAPAREGVSLLALAAGAALGGAPFLVDGWLFTGNPVYPLVFGGLNWTADNTRLLHLLGCPGVDWSPGSGYLSALWRLLTEHMPLMLLALPFLSRAVISPVSPAVFVWAVSAAAWLVLVPCIRYMMPLLAPLALLAALGLSRASVRPGAPARIRTLLTLVVLAAGAIQAVAGADFFKRSFAAGMGLESRGKHLARVLTTYDDAATKAAQLLPASARLVVVGESRGYGFRQLAIRRYMTDTPLMLELAHRANTPDDIRRFLRQTGASHVLLNYVTSEFEGIFQLQALGWKSEARRLFHDYWVRHARPVFIQPGFDRENGGFVLYALSNRPVSPPRAEPFLPGTEGLAAARPGESDGEHLARLKSLAYAYPDITNFSCRLGFQLVAMQKYAEAVGPLKRATATGFPGPDMVWGNLGLAYRGAGRLGDAARAFAKAEEYNPQNPAYRNLRLVCEKALRGKK